MDYKMDIFKENNVPYDWLTLYVGIKKSFLDYSEITKHAIRVLSQEANISNGNIVDLACGDINLGYEEILFEIINGLSINNFNEGSSKWNFELRKWRYCILKYLRSRYSNLQVMLEKVSEIYDSTGYPEEMENFIIYMPPKCGYEPSLHTHEENMIRLALLLDEFLVNEKKDYWKNVEYNKANGFKGLKRKL